MTREEFEVKYAMKYWGGDFTHNPAATLESMKSNREGEGYADHHIDACWKIQEIKSLIDCGCVMVDDLIHQIEGTNW